VNACKFSKIKGEITLKVRALRAEDFPEMVKAFSGKQCIILETKIIDHGEGMTEKKQKQLFKMFSKINQNPITP